MQTKEFHLGDILSITTGRLVSPRHIGGVYAILNFMTGDNLFTHQLPRAADECKPYLLKWFPQLATPEMDLAIAELEKTLKTQKGRQDPKKIVADWLCKQVAKYGEVFVVKPIPKGTHEFKNSITEAVEMMGGPEKVIIGKLTN